MSPHFERAVLLYQQHRFDLAERELRLALADDPNDAFLHAYLALCLAEADKGDAALIEAREAVGLAPDFAFAHYALAAVLFQVDQYAAADRAVTEAIGLDPSNAPSFALRAQIRLQQSRWKEALEAAEQGLALDPEDVTCANLRGMALTQLGRKEEAQAALRGTLALDPENAFSHANQGWTLLHRGDPYGAQVHFREALRIDPNLDYARQGIVEALKARNPIYRAMLRFFLWMGRLSQGAQWAVIFAVIVGRRLLNQVARENPALRPLVVPILVGLFLFIYLSWIAYPLFNLTLRLHPIGKHALSRDQRRGANLVGLCLLGGLIGLLAFLAAIPLRSAPSAVVGLLMFGYFACLVIPVAGTFATPKGTPRRIMAVITLGLAAFGGYTLTRAALTGGAGANDPQAMTGASTFLLGCFLSTWVPALLGSNRAE